LGQGTTLTILLPLLPGEDMIPANHNEDVHGGE